MEGGRSTEQEEIKRPARMRDQGGEGLDDTLGTTDGVDAGGVGAQVGAEQPQSQGDIEDPEGLGGASGSGGDPECHGGARVTEDEGGTGGREEPDGWRDEAELEEWSPVE